MTDFPPSPNPQKSRFPAWLILALLTAGTSLGAIQKHTGFMGCMLYTLAVVALFYLLRRFSGFWAPCMRRHFRLLSPLVFGGILVSFAIGYSIENGKGPGKSSDRDEGLNIAVTRMIAGENPYYPSNPNAGPLSLLPGSITLAAPFVALGNSAYQNLFWLGVFFAASYWLFKDSALALALLCVPFAASPSLLHEFFSGGDLIANGIFVTAFSLAALTVWSNPKSPHWSRGLTCLLLGISLASRANFILLAPLFGAVVWQISGPRKAFFSMLVVGLAILAIIVPFYLRDPTAFTPLMSRQKLAANDHTIPWASSAVLVLTIFASIFASFRLIQKHPSPAVLRFFRACTAVTLTPILLSILIATWANGHIDFGILHERFGIMFLFLALIGWGGQWITDSSDSKSAPPSEPTSSLAPPISTP